MKSIMAVGIGLLLALVLGLLVVQGIFAPVFTRFFGLERTGPAALPLVLLVFAAAFSFYFGGMAASYKAPFSIVCTGFWSSPQRSFFPWCSTWSWAKDSARRRWCWAVGLVVVFLVVSCAASYVGARRGEALYAHNQKVKRRRANVSSWSAAPGAATL